MSRGGQAEGGEKKRTKGEYENRKGETGCDGGIGIKERPDMEGGDTNTNEACRVTLCPLGNRPHASSSFFSLYIIPSFLLPFLSSTAVSLSDPDIDGNGLCLHEYEHDNDSGLPLLTFRRSRCRRQAPTARLSPTQRISSALS